MNMYVPPERTHRATKAYNLKVQVRNNYLLAVMRAHGIATAAELSRLSGVSKSEVGHLLNLTAPGTNLDGGWKRSLVRIADALQVTPDMLIPPQHISQPLEKNWGEVEVSVEEIQQLVGDSLEGVQETPFDTLVQSERKDCLSWMISCLTSREERVIEKRFGLSGAPLTHEEIGRELHLCRGHVAAIEKKAINKLRDLARKGPYAKAICELMGLVAEDSSKTRTHQKFARLGGWQDSSRRVFEPARTVEPGNPSFKLTIKEKETT